MTLNNNDNPILKLALDAKSDWDKRYDEELTLAAPPFAKKEEEEDEDEEETSDEETPEEDEGSEDFSEEESTSEDTPNEEDSDYESSEDDGEASDEETEEGDEEGGETSEEEDEGSGEGEDEETEEGEPKEGEPILDENGEPKLDKDGKPLLKKKKFDPAPKGKGDFDFKGDPEMEHASVAASLGLAPNRLHPALTLADGDWDESQHPRGEGGKFAPKEGAAHATSLQKKAELTKAPPTKEPNHLIGRWESGGGKHWVELHQVGANAFAYKANDAGGTLAAKTADEAKAELTKKVDSGYFLPDNAKTPMREVTRATNPLLADAEKRAANPPPGMKTGKGLKHALGYSDEQIGETPSATVKTAEPEDMHQTLLDLRKAYKDASAASNAVPGSRAGRSYTDASDDADRASRQAKTAEDHRNAAELHRQAAEAHEDTYMEKRVADQVRQAHEDAEAKHLEAAKMHRAIMKKLLNDQKRNQG